MRFTSAELKALLARTARRLTGLQNQGLAEVCPIGIVDFERWEWPQGVGLYGLFNYTQLTQDPDSRATIEGWYERRLREGMPPRNVNTMAPMLTLTHLAAQSGDPARLALCTEWAEWIMREMPRTEEHGLQHIVSGEENPQQLWDDTLYMTVLFLAKMGVVLQRQDYLDEAVRQFLLHTKYLVDRRTGLWFHGWTFDGRHHFAEARWARGNCWITAGTFDFLAMAPIDGGVKAYLVDMVTAQVAALARCQNANGMWHTLLDDPTSYVETSATAGFAYGILKGVRLGLLDSRYRASGERALAAVVARIGEDGTVREVSYGTGMGRDLDHYRRIPQCPMAYGQALAILLLGEALQLGA